MFWDVICSYRHFAVACSVFRVESKKRAYQMAQHNIQKTWSCISLSASRKWNNIFTNMKLLSRSALQHNPTWRRIRTDASYCSGKPRLDKVRQFHAWILMALCVAWNLLLKWQKEVQICLLHDFECGRKQFLAEDYFNLWRDIIQFHKCLFICLIQQGGDFSHHVSQVILFVVRKKRE